MAQTTTTYGKWTREDTLRQSPGHEAYDPTRALRFDEWRCPDCGFIATTGSSADVAHDNLCDLPVDAATGEPLDWDKIR